MRWGDGCLYHLVYFRLVVFRPFTNEALVGRIMSSSSESIRGAWAWFGGLTQKCRWASSTTFSFRHTSSRRHQRCTCRAISPLTTSDYQEQAWFWLLDPASDAHRADPLLSAPEERMYLDNGETVRFAIESDQFFDVERGPSAGESKPGDAAGVLGNIPGDAGTKGAVHQSAYRITGSITGQGLGLLSWWAGAEQVSVGEER